MNRPLAVLLAMAMFVLVVDTSIMNVSISAVVRDLGTTVSGVQGAIALEALVSAAFILIGSKVGDLIGRKRAYVLGLLGYAIGAAAMTLAQNLFAIVFFWAIIGGIGASLLLPSMQSLIHGNFQGAAQKQVYALVGAAAAIAAAVGPLLGGFITTFFSWRIAFLLELVIIIVVLSGIKLVRDVPYMGSRVVDVVGCAPLDRGHGRHRARHPGLARGRRIRAGDSGQRRDCACWLCHLADPSQAARKSDADRSRLVPV
jgi:MFS family permease